MMEKTWSAMSKLLSYQLYSAPLYGADLENGSRDAPAPTPTPSLSLIAYRDAHPSGLRLPVDKKILGRPVGPIHPKNEAHRDFQLGRSRRSCKSKQARSDCHL